MLSKYLKTILNGGVPEREVRPLEDGLNAFEAGKHDESLPLLLEALKDAPHTLAALVAVGRIYHTRGTADEAVKFLLRALELDGRNPLVNYLLGELALNEGNATMAAKFFEKALSTDPDYTDAHIRLGMAYRELKQPQEAIKAFEKAIFLDRQAVVARFQLAQVCLEVKDTRRALTQLHLVKEIHGDYPPVFLLQGEIQFGLGDYRQAIIELERALELGLDGAHARELLGRANDRLGNREGAIKAYVGCLERENRPHIRFRLAEILEELRKYSAAQEHYTILVDDRSYGDAAQEALKRIKQLLADIATELAGESS